MTSSSVPESTFGGHPDRSRRERSIVDMCLVGVWPMAFDLEHIDWGVLRKVHVDPAFINDLRSVEQSVEQSVSQLSARASACSNRHLIRASLGMMPARRKA
jgi:hypothetical protein